MNGMTSACGRVEEIFVYPERRRPASARQDAVAVRGVGLEGDHRRSAGRALTLVSREAWAQAMAELGADLPPQTRRANLVVSGIDLAALVGRRLRVGEAELRIGGETAPCALMELQRAGLRSALARHLRGGVFGTVEQTGRICRGDAIALLSEPG